MEPLPSDHKKETDHGGSINHEKWRVWSFVGNQWSIGRIYRLASAFGANALVFVIARPRLIGSGLTLRMCSDRRRTITKSLGSKGPPGPNRRSWGPIVWLSFTDERYQLAGGSVSARSLASASAAAIASRMDDARPCRNVSSVSPGRQTAQSQPSRWSRGSTTSR